jgi:hypothetical protein
LKAISGKAGADEVAKAAGVLAGGVGTTAALEGEAVADALLCAPAKADASGVGVEVADSGTWGGIDGAGATEDGTGSVGATHCWA